jgi:hypothetical protein
MRQMIRASVSLVTSNSLFDSAYPSAEKAEFETYHREVFVECAKELKYFEIVKRVRKDDELVKLCARVVSIYISHSVSTDLLPFSDQCSHLQLAYAVQESH